MTNLPPSQSVSALADLYDPLSAQSHEDPYPSYAVLRAQAPVYYCARHDVWALSRYADVRAALRDWQRFTSTQGVEMADYVGFFGEGNFLELDPPAHDTIRRILAPRFLTRAMRSYEPIVRQSADEILDELPNAGEVDLGTGFTQRLPVLTICRLLGIPAAQVPWAVTATTEMMTRPAGESGPSDRAAQLRTELVELFRSEVARRGNGAEHDDILGDIARAIHEGVLTVEDIPGICLLLIAAGMETTTSLLGSIVDALASGAVTAEEILQDGMVSGEAIDEFLRYDAPVQWLCRVTTEPVTLHGVTIPAGARVLMLYGSANRDPEVFDAPDELRIGRDTSRHLSFGEGIHFCLGMPLAKLETRVGIAGLLGRYRRLKSAGSPQRYPSHIIRGFERIPVIVGD